jgi:nitrite reductase/ring-hydroxylating ferredoxin subunit
MPTFLTACPASEIAPGTGKQLTVGGKDLAVFNVDGTFYALDNTCPHRGGPLAEGELEGCAVTCPWHAWTFDLKTGASLTDDLKVACYDAKVEGESVLIGT